MPQRKFHVPHPWRVSYARARKLQTELRDSVILIDQVGTPLTVAGTDVGFEQNNTVARGAVVVLSYPDLSIVESAVARRKVHFPYVPGYLSFREVPSLLAALEKLTQLPDLILCDGQGHAHPRRFGLASHLGVVTGIPTVGVGKTRLIGSHSTVGEHKGSWQPLTHKEETIGAVLRSRSNCNPIYVSCGHKLTLSSAIDFTLSCCTRYRLPETTRAAHTLASGGSNT